MERSIRSQRKGLWEVGLGRKRDCGQNRKRKVIKRDGGKKQWRFFWKSPENPSQVLFLWERASASGEFDWQFQKCIHISLSSLQTEFYNILPFMTSQCTAWSDWIFIDSVTFSGRRVLMASDSQAQTFKYCMLKVFKCVKCFVLFYFILFFILYYIFYCFFCCCFFCCCFLYIF